MLQMTQLLINCAKLVEVEVEKELLRMQNLNKDTALHEAVLNGHFEVVNLLINEDPELAQFVNHAGESSLFIAVDRKYYKIACLILEAAPMCSSGGRSSMNVLHVAIIRADKRLLFVATNMLINIVTLYLKIIVLYVNQFLPAASKIGCLQIKLSYKFISVGADFISEVLKRCPSAIHEADRFGWIPLHYAAHFGNVEVVDLLLQCDISLAYAKNKEGMSALHLSAKAGQDDVILLFIARYPDIYELIDGRGRTALHVAAESGKSSVIKIFLSTPVLSDLMNSKDNDGNTPFHSAATQGHCDALLLLANDCRVDKGAINKAGLSAFDIIKSSTHFKQHKKAQILWKLKTRGALSSLEHLGSIETIELQAIETQGQCQPQQIGYNKPGGDVGKKNESKHVAMYGEAEHRKEKKNASRPIKEMENVNLLVATIIAGITFAAALVISGGCYSDGKENQGMAFLSKRSGFTVFMVASSFAFGLSTASIFIQFGASRVKKDRIVSYLVQCTFLFTEWSIYAMVLAFIAGTSTVLTRLLGLSTAIMTIVCFLLGPLIYALVTSNLYS